MGLLASVLVSTQASVGTLLRVRPESPVTPMDRANHPANNTPMLATDPTDERFVVLANRLDAPEFSCGLQVSFDGGRGWIGANPVAKLPSGAEECYAPEVAFDSRGTLYYLFVGLAGGGHRPMGAFLETSSDRGRTFSPPRTILGPLNFSVRMAIDPTVGPYGRLHLVWLHAGSDVALGAFGPPPNPILAAYSDDGGSTFSKPVQVSDPERQRVVAPALVLGPHHAVHVAYYDLGADAVDYQGLDGPVWDQNWTLVLNTSADGGVTFGHGGVVDGEIRPPERVMLIFTMPAASLATGPGGLVCAAWTDSRYGDPDALLRCSGKGMRWGPVRRLNDDRQSNGLRQYLPRIGIAPNGRIDAIFYDRRRDVLNMRNDVYYTFSMDGGHHFSRNARMTRDSSSSEIGQQYAGPAARGQVEFGSRLALLSRKRSALAAWTDTRNSVPRVTTDQDIFSAEAELGLSRLARLGVVAGPLAAGFLFLCAWYRRARARRRQPADA